MLRASVSVPAVFPSSGCSGPVGVVLEAGEARTRYATKALQVERVTPDAPCNHTTSANTSADVPVAGLQSYTVLRRQVPTREIEILCAFYACLQRRLGAFRTASGGRAQSL